MRTFFFWAVVLGFIGYLAYPRASAAILSLVQRGERPVLAYRCEQAAQRYFRSSEPAADPVVDHCAIGVTGDNEHPDLCFVSRLQDGERKTSAEPIPCKEFVSVESKFIYKN